ncbi:hypothetical protein A3I27_01590 [Candidatus Giovannonibacteria bacterium RIFCSPLOWO2_02_FULL_43_11b]|uniref:6-phosphogluconate dehydrogenase (Decarboxylating) n=1 Tax=Candidatus Giovannonibacteria bacterium RIFCSPHIGHO2_12_FULL_43_15 TaxID=1798341 RepID=A0A1F5WP52_9BACT|nr:MAG: hypothetical protein A2739_01065 [Candidatus Giovannonibacteria bacterium RIFCSPHIGHO2_01_FULL_43_100]OGF66466.1 MAG: hypothetical protein A3B97_03865 [Candidatus Giovannonibacteria bacterium RIFCSPHIGHO2_02_FULL_43_32]OGF77415.1 MAG: hypothetical protein A3F23_03650 [Candidatus Giovannonibacteria bacterium RIFCSPHIGHO2_12_FULL_43_15]OGF78437.1 MAG: hypothetical protein A3A15_03440 [Candidatus Giovannonibacteria bacterium RIFCSPLOWO2_01_FULL_43_60]OGF89798.1 MAG: hypothetical protein A3
MGGNMTLRLRERGWRVLGLDKGDDFSRVRNLPIPRVIILSVPHQAVDSLWKSAIKFLDMGDIVIDAGNSFYKDTIRRAKEFSRVGIKFIDAGVSGGPAGARHGSSLMIGGDKKIFNFLKPLFRDLAFKDGFQFFSGAGAGHFVKMVHNGIEYGMMQALAEGFTILKKSKYKIDLKKAAEIYNNGSVIESRLIGWITIAFENYGQDFNGVSGKVGSTGEGEWTVKTAKEFKVNAKVLEDALKFRIKSQKNPDWTGKLLSALRGEFGGHKIK